MILKMWTPVLLKEYQGTHKLGIGIVVAMHRDGGIEDAPITYDALFELVDFDGVVLVEGVEINELLPIIVYGPNSGSIHQLEHVAEHEFGIDKSLNIGEVKLKKKYIAKDEFLDEINEFIRNEA